MATVTTTRRVLSAAILGGMAWPWIAACCVRWPLRAAVAGVVTWAGVAALAGTMQVETVYGVVTWLAASWAAFVPPRPRPVATG